MVDRNILDTLSIALRDAIDILESFPSIEKIESIDLNSESLTVKVLWVITLPTKFCGVGVTTSGICTIESVQWVFPLNYPLTAPQPSLRVNFPKTLPHINPFNVNDRVPPCIAELSLEDLLHSVGLEAILHAMDDWLSHAASGELHCPVQGWESIRRDSIAGIISADTYAIKSELDSKVVPVRYFGYRYSFWNDNNEYGLGILTTPSLGSSNSAFKQKQAFIASSSGVRFGPALLLQMEEGNVATEYWPETISNFGELRKLAHRLGLISALDARVRYLLSVSGPEACRAKNKKPIEEFLVIFAVKRPFNLIGTNSTWELLAYRVCYTESVQSGLPDDTPVFAPILVNRTSPALLQSTSGRKCGLQKHIAVIGCGSLGSKLSLHLAKTGRYTFKLMDDDYFSSHNNARHGLIADGLNCIGARKVNLLESEIRKLNVDVDKLRGNVVTLSAHGEQIFNKNTDYVVDTTASLVVRHWLAHHCDELPGRLMHVVLYGNATMGALAVEGMDRTIRIDDLTAYMNTLCIENSSIQKAMYGGKQVSRQVFDEGCSSATATMSDIDISLLATALTAKLDRHVIHSSSEMDGALIIGLVNSELNLDWLQYKFSETLVIQADDKFVWNIRVLGHVVEEIRGQASRNPSVEEGGVLAGYVCNLSKTIYVTYLLPAPAGSVRSATKFLLKTEGLKEKFNDIHSATNGQISFLGTWHSHTLPTPPSKLDEMTLTELTQSYDMPVVMLTYTGGRLVRV